MSATPVGDLLDHIAGFAAAFTAAARKTPLEAAASGNTSSAVGRWSQR